MNGGAESTVERDIFCVAFSSRPRTSQTGIEVGGFCEINTGDAVDDVLRAREDGSMYNRRTLGAGGRRVRHGLAMSKGADAPG